MVSGEQCVENSLTTLLHQLPVTCSASGRFLSDDNTVCQIVVLIQVALTVLKTIKRTGTGNFINILCTSCRPYNYPSYGRSCLGPGPLISRPLRASRSFISIRQTAPNSTVSALRASAVRYMHEYDFVNLKSF